MDCCPTVCGAGGYVSTRLDNQAGMTMFGSRTAAKRRVEVCPMLENGTESQHAFDDLPPLFLHHSLEYFFDNFFR